MQRTLFPFNLLLCPELLHPSHLRTHCGLFAHFMGVGSSNLTVWLGNIIPYNSPKQSFFTKPLSHGYLLLLDRLASDDPRRFLSCRFFSTLFFPQLHPYSGFGRHRAIIGSNFSFTKKDWRRQSIAWCVCAQEGGGGGCTERFHVISFLFIYEEKP